jgi:hypothetical protein
MPTGISSCTFRDIGRECAQVWIENHFDDLGVESTIDIRGTYL